MAFRTHNFSLRLTELEISNYERLAKESGVPVSEWMRDVLNAEVRYKEEQVSLPPISKWLGQPRHKFFDALAVQRTMPTEEEEER